MEFSALSFEPSPFSRAVQAIEQAFQRGTWVQLRQSLVSDGCNQALILCQEGDDRWLAWVPNLGEVSLRSHQFDWDCVV